MKILSKLNRAFQNRLLTKSPQTRTRTLVERISEESLLNFYGNLYSQTGQDGILTEIFRRISISKGIFVEFGAWDGLYLSNTRWLYEKGWDGVLIEKNKKKFNRLNSLYDNTNTFCINALVGCSEDDCLRAIIGDDLNVDSINFVSIDVDGMDLDIFQSMGFKPDVVVLEGGFSFSPFLKDSVPNSVAHLNLQQPLYQIEKVAKKMGYSLICFYQDSYLVREDHSNKFPSFDIVSLYEDGFNFMPDQFRDWLIDFRGKHKKIKAIESKYFKKFNPNPLGYLPKIE